MTNDAQSEYIAARLEWDDRFASQRKTVRALGAITILSLGIGALGLGYGILTGARTQYIPYIVQVDQLGRTEIAADPVRVGNWPAHVIKRELELFIQRYRTVSPDLSVVSQNHHALEKFLPSGSAAVEKIRNHMSQPANDPVKRAAVETVSVEIKSVNFVSGSSWRVEWVEAAYARQSGRARGAKRFVGIVQIEFRTPKSREILKDNPLGLFLVDLDVQEVGNE